MKKVVIISPIGLSPGVVTEVLYSVGEFEEITDVSIVATSDTEVQASAKLVGVGIEVEYPELKGKKVYTHIHTLKFSDVNSSENAVEFVKEMTNIMKKEIELHNPAKILFNIAGSRKVESAIMLMLGMLWRVHRVYHVIHKHVKSFNIEVERARQKINDILKVENPVDYYIENRDIFHNILFPSPNIYSVFEIPFVPFSRMEINAIKELLRGTDLMESPFSRYELKLYRKMGLILIGSERTYTTELGQAFLEVLEL